MRRPLLPAIFHSFFLSSLDWYRTLRESTWVNTSADSGAFWVMVSRSCTGRPVHCFTFVSQFFLWLWTPSKVLWRTTCRVGSHGGLTVANRGCCCRLRLTTVLCKSHWPQTVAEYDSLTHSFLETQYRLYCGHSLVLDPSRPRLYGDLCVLTDFKVLFIYWNISVYLKEPVSFTGQTKSKNLKCKCKTIRVSCLLNFTPGACWYYLSIIS